MLRITTNRNELGVVLKLEGQLIGPWVNELEQACLVLDDSLETIQLDLLELSFADHNGARLLASLLADRVKLASCSHFVRAQIESHSKVMTPMRCVTGSAPAGGRQ